MTEKLRMLFESSEIEVDIRLRKPKGWRNIIDNLEQQPIVGTT